MSTISKVALAGATGNLGPAILKALQDAGFQVTVLTRHDSSNQPPSDVPVVDVDYESLDSLTDALKGHDAVVSTLGSAVIATQLLLVEAAGKVGIKRFIPSEFGSDTAQEKTGALPVFQPKVQVAQALEKQVTTSGMSYTRIITGPFLDWGIMVGFLMNPMGKSINLYDGGDRTFSATTLPTVGKAVASTLQNLEATKNRCVYVQDTATTLRALGAKGKKATGGPDGWKEEHVATDDCLAKAWEELKKEKPNPEVFAYNFIFASVFGEGYGSHFQKLDNDVLGIKQMSEDEVQAVVNRYA